MNNKLALEGGSPVRENRLPYGRQWIDDEDIQIRCQAADRTRSGERPHPLRPGGRLGQRRAQRCLSKGIHQGFSRITSS